MIKATTTPNVHSQDTASSSSASPKEKLYARENTVLPAPFNTPFFRALIAFYARALNVWEKTEMADRDQSATALESPSPRHQAMITLVSLLDAYITMLLRWGSPEAKAVIDGACDLACMATPEDWPVPLDTLVLGKKATRTPKRAKMAEGIAGLRPAGVNANDVPALWDADLGQLLAHSLGCTDGEPVQSGIEAVADDLESWHVILGEDVSFESTTPKLLASSIENIQHRLMVLAELHRRQLAARDEQIAELRRALEARAE